MIKNILVTGANGFIGKHVSLKLERAGYNIFKYDLDNTEEELVNYVKKADYLVHLAGINRPMSVEEFYDGNSNFTKKLIDLLKDNGKNIPVIFSSSIQAALDNDYGKSKKMAEDYLLDCGLPVNVFRLANVFGKWCRPNYNSAAATFCYNIAHDLEITIRDPNYVVHFNYVDDIVNEFINCIKNGTSSKDILYVQPTHDCSLGKLADLLYYFKKEIESDRHLPILHDEFELKLFKTFCDYLSEDGYSFNYAADARGSFEELYKSKKWGQISENISFPHIIKGGHYHTYKKEIFYTVKGKCEIKQRNVKSDEMLVDVVDGKDGKMVDIIPMYTHSIENIGETNSHTIMWISEIYDEKTADTYREPVVKE
ncbi:MAG: NAD-dependent epimerase/dehydratase family protein [Bacilli bacterium]|nr:NAD-dependent epimerase/dehydratase family protein [Bacilli bacterium]